jgi:hypothetical protein
MNDTTPLAPPRAAKKPSSVTHHGITVEDHYAWLRDAGYPKVTDKEVLAHLAAENAWFEARMKPHQGLIDRCSRRCARGSRKPTSRCRRRTATGSTGSSSRKAPNTRSGGASRSAAARTS